MSEETTNPSRSESDPGHDSLILDLELLIKDAKAYEFHDFHNERYANPKQSLVYRLQELLGNTTDGKYDN